MTLALLRSALVVSVAVVGADAVLRGQAPVRNPVANQPAPRSADGRIVLGNTTTLKGVWIGGNLGFCNSNTVAAPPRAGKRLARASTLISGSDMRAPSPQRHGGY